MQKIIWLALCAVLALFQYELWFGHGGIYDAQHIQAKINEQSQLNQKLQKRNDEIYEHLQELKGLPDLIEARSRRELNLVKPKEILMILPDKYLLESGVKK